MRDKDTSPITKMALRKLRSNIFTICFVVVWFGAETMPRPSAAVFSQSVGIPTLSAQAGSQRTDDIASHISDGEHAAIGARILDSSDVAVKGTYSNYDYAFSTRVPRGLVGHRPSAPNPNHGFVIRLPKGKGELSVDASYNAAEWSSLEDALMARRQTFKDQTGGESEIINRRSASLGGLKAIEFVIKSPHSNNGNTMMCAGIIAFRSVPGEVGIVYELSLTTPQTAYPTTRKLVRTVQQSFRLRSLPK